MSRIARITAAYAFGHIVVDLACIATMMGLVSPCFARFGAQQAALAVLAYDMVAFCLQLPLGALLDALGRRVSQRAGLASLALVAAGVSCGWRGGVPFVLAALALVATGNALFHCVGGVEVLGESDGRAAPSGLFISTGAAGVFLGSLGWFCGWAHLPILLLVLLLASAVALVLAPQAHVGGELRLSLGRTGWTAVALLALTVALRSYTGIVMAFPWKASFPLAVCSLAAVVAGKALGGMVADRWGAPAASLVSLGGAAVAFLPSWTHPVAGLVATWLFNFTMAITLSGLARLLPQARGMAFGIASFSLAIGAFPALVGNAAASGVTLCGLSLLSLALLEAGLALAKEARTHA